MELGTVDSVVVDRRELSQREQRAIQSWLERTRLTSRILYLDPPVEESPAREDGWRSASLKEGVSAAALAAAVHFGLGRHDVLIEAMRALASRLPPLGRRVVVEVLSQRFLQHRVADIAASLGLHRTRLHRLLENAGDPPPKKLIDSCYTMTTALLLRDPIPPAREVQGFMRAKDARTLRESVRRCSGVKLGVLRRCERTESNQTQLPAK